MTILTGKLTIITQEERGVSVDRYAGIMPSIVQESRGFGIKEVWHDNLEHEFRKIRRIVQKYNCVAMVCSYFQIFIFQIYKYLVFPFYFPLHV